MSDRIDPTRGDVSSSRRNNSWWNSITRLFGSDPVAESQSRNDEDEDEEPLLPSRLSSSKRRRLYTGWEQLAAYLVLLVLGLVVGGFIGRWYSSRDGGKDHGPMVAPVWTLPPVSSPSPLLFF
jgi:hypothetical protein